MEQESIKALRERLIEELAEPEEVQTDSGRVKRQAISEQITALDYLEKLETRTGKGQVRRIGLYKFRNKD